MQKQCFKCKVIKPLEDFYKHPQMPDGRVGKCKECNKSDVRTNYALKREMYIEYDHYRHRYSIPRIFNHRYSALKHRCLNGRNGKPYRVTGSKFLSKREWLEWCYSENNYKKFIEIYNNWVKNDFQEKFSPSIDRVDNNKSYVIGNLQWLTKSENCSKHTK
jgi:hypothetical protein